MIGIKQWCHTPLHASSLCIASWLPDCALPFLLLSSTKFLSERLLWSSLGIFISTFVPSPTGHWLKRGLPYNMPPGYGWCLILAACGPTGDLTRMDFELSCARSCQGNQPPRNPNANGLPRGPHPRAPLGAPAMAPAAGPPTHGYGSQNRRPYQGFPTYPHNPLLSQISQNPLLAQQAHPQSLQMSGALFADDPSGHLQGGGPTHRRGSTHSGVSAPWAAAHLNGLGQVGGQRTPGGPNGWEDQLRYMQSHRGLTRDGPVGTGPAGPRSRAPMRSTSAGNLHEASMLVRSAASFLDLCSIWLSASLRCACLSGCMPSFPHALGSDVFASLTLCRLLAFARQAVVALLGCAHRQCCCAILLCDEEGLAGKCLLRS